MTQTYTGYHETLPLKPGDTVTLKPHTKRIKLDKNLTKSLTKRTTQVKIAWVGNGCNHPGSNPAIYYKSGRTTYEVELNDVL